MDLKHLTEVSVCNASCVTLACNLHEGEKEEMREGTIKMQEKEEKINWSKSVKMSKIRKSKEKQEIKMK